MNQELTNLLFSLSKWAPSQQENFLSEAFVHLMNLLAREAPQGFVAVIERMSHGLLKPTIESAADFSLATQISTSEGMPDIEITGPDSYALVEVKDESPVNEGQVARYQRLVEQNNAGSRCLILLTRYQLPPLPKSPLLKTVRWTQIAQWLTESNERFDSDETSSFMLRQFLGFLEAKGMSVSKAGWEMLPGIKQFKNFKVLLQQAMESAGAHKIWTSSGADFNGWAIPDRSLNTAAFYAFIRFGQPETLIFSCKPMYVRDEFRNDWFVDKNDRDSLSRSLDLESEAVHFFSRSLDSQRGLLEEFISSCLSQTTYEPSGQDGA